MSLSPVTITRLRAVKKAILKQPRLYNQCFPCIPKNHPHFPSCNTPGCILGWAAMMFGNKKSVAKDQSVEAVGRLALRLGVVQGERLFHGGFSAYCHPASHVLRRLHTRYCHAPRGSLARAECAARRIDHFIKTDGRE